MTVNAKLKISIVFILPFIILAVSYCSAQVISPEVESAITSAPRGEGVSVIVKLKDKAAVESLKYLRKELRREKLVQSLQSKAQQTQEPLLALLREKKAKRVMAFWIFNGLAVTAEPDLIRELSIYPQVESITLDATLEVPKTAQATSATAQWNINQIHAPEVWGLGFTGEGAVVATMDTGVDVHHPDLASKWRGGSNSWFDPNNEHFTPYDADGHGTAVMGIILGGDAGGTAIGVAPAAEWIAVKIFNDSGLTAYSTIHSGFQWLLDPDRNPQTDDAADIVNNSWGMNQNVNEYIAEFRDDIIALKTAGIAVVCSAGNEGPNFNTSVSPANYPESFSVGSTDSTAVIANFSSRGPSAFEQGLFPTAVAPGVNIYTCDLTLGGVIPNSYTNLSGTSFSCAHVSGAMALLLSAVPGSSMQELESALTQSALDLGEAGPDNTYGFGLIDVSAAYNKLLEPPAPCPDADGDGFYALGGCAMDLDCNDSDPNIHPHASEIKHDGIDQDCNGYDLTIGIIKARYQARKDTLSVEATSALGKEAGLALAGYGPMKWSNKKQQWSITVKFVKVDPGSVTVSGIEGSETVHTELDSAPPGHSR